MNMSKNAARTLIVAAIVLVLFCVLAFAIPFARGGVFWLAFVFTVIAILAQLYVAKKAFANGESARSKFYGFPIARLGLIYLVVQFVVALVFMALGALLPMWVAVVVFVVILAAAALGFIAADAMRDEVERQDVVLKKNVTAMRELQSRSEAIAAQCDDPAVKATLTALAEKFRYSDPVSGESTADAEAELSSMMDELQAAMVDCDTTAVSLLASKLETKLNERNRLCKLNK